MQFIITKIINIKQSYLEHYVGTISFDIFDQYWITKLCIMITIEL